CHALRMLARRDDLVLDMQGTLKTRLQLLGLRSRQVVGYDASIARDGVQHRYDRQVSPRGARHRVQQGLQLVGALGVPVPRVPARPRLAVPDVARARVRERLAALPGEGLLVVLHPGTSAFGELKRWAPELFAELGRALAERHGARIVVTGGPSEA